jgi:hypothetical protein
MQICYIIMIMTEPVTRHTFLALRFFFEAFGSSAALAAALSKAAAAAAETKTHALTRSKMGGWRANGQLCTPATSSAFSFFFLSFSSARSACGAA